MSLAFTPLVAGNISGTVNVTSDAANVTSGTTVVSVVAVNPNTRDFSLAAGRTYRCFAGTTRPTAHAHTRNACSAKGSVAKNWRGRRNVRR
jgi:hypothetical protein